MEKDKDIKMTPADIEEVIKGVEERVEQQPAEDWKNNGWLKN